MTPTAIAGLILLAIIIAGGVYMAYTVHQAAKEPPRAPAEPDAAEELAREQGELCLQPSWTDADLRCQRPYGHMGLHRARGMEWVNRDPTEEEG